MLLAKALVRSAVAPTTLLRCKAHVRSTAEMSSRWLLSSDINRLQYLGYFYPDQRLHDYTMKRTVSGCNVARAGRQAGAGDPHRSSSGEECASTLSVGWVYGIRVRAMASCSLLFLYRIEPSMYVCLPRESFRFRCSEEAAQRGVYV